MDYRIDLAVSLTLLSPLHVGTGLGIVGGADSAVARNGEGDPVIPGSSLKGRLRYQFCRVAAFCPAFRPSHAAGGLCGPGVAPCPECVVFGSPAHPARFSFADGLPAVPPLGRQILRRIGETNRMGVTISRRRGVAQERLLYSLEVTPAEVVFETRIVGRVAAASSAQAAETHELLGLLLAIQLLETLGGRKSAGLGRVQAVTHALSVVGGIELSSTDAVVGHLSHAAASLGKRVSP